MTRLSLVAALAVGLALPGCGGGGSSGSKAGQTNGYGDPYITDAQAQSVRIGESDTAVFQALGGRAVSGSFAPSASAPAYIRQAYAQNPVDCYDYPLADRPSATWEFCFKYGKLVRKTPP